MPRLQFLTLCAVIAALSASAAATGRQRAQPSRVPPGASGMTFDVVVLDKDGRVPDSLGPADFSVSIDGNARRVLSLRRVSRGPGATTDAATRRARAAGLTTFAAEPVRNILVVIDQASLVRGQEKAAVAASQAFLDRLGMADRLAVVLLPFPRDQMLSLATEPPVARQALARVVGQIDPALAAKPDVPALAPPGNLAVSDPERLREAEPVPAVAPPPAIRGPEAPLPAGALNGLASLLDAIRTVPGRKVVAFFSAGVANPSPAQLFAVAASATAARAAIYVFTLPGPRDDSALTLQAAPLEALAKAAGGALVSLGRNPERTIGRTAAELAACYTLELEPAAMDTDGKRHALRVEVAGRDLTVRAPAWLIPAPDAGDLPAEAPVPAGDSGAPPAHGDTGARTARAPETPSGREAELQLAMARLLDYVGAYERQYSVLVAEEEYRQASRGWDVRLRSDYLLVKPERSSEWVSFRDVYEVDGVAVRDRDDRLKRLFLEPGVDVQAQLLAIRKESARYNIGAVERNINVPLFPLQFLTAENRPRFRFRLAGKRHAAGVDTWRVQFDEQSKPTIIGDLQGHDVAAKGWFLVDEITGAIVQTGLEVDENASHGEIIVSYRHDPALGLWVPSEMTETYRTLPRLQPLSSGKATYSKYRRFQVKTEEKIVIPK
jgi:VWFA-related protein